MMEKVYEDTFNEVENTVATKKSLVTRYYERSEKVQKRYISYVSTSVRNAEGTLENTMSTIVERVLKGYHNDFYLHDIQMLNEKSAFEYIWIVREYGTFLVDLLSPYKCEDKLSFEIDFAMYRKNFELVDTTECYHVKSEDGQASLAKVTFSQAEEIVINNVYKMETAYRVYAYKIEDMYINAKGVFKPYGMDVREALTYEGFVKAVTLGMYSI